MQDMHLQGTQAQNEYYTVLPAVHTFNPWVKRAIPAFPSKLQNNIALWPVLISHPGN